MKHLGIIILFILIIPLTANSQNRVLQLDGDGDYVQLPSDIFNDLDKATVEAWVKWEKFGYFSQPFGFGSIDTWDVMVVNNELYTSNLQFFFYIQRQLHLIKTDKTLQLNRWCHIAAVSGGGGMKLYLNGVLVGEHKYTGSFSALKDNNGNYFGKPHWSDNDFFKGQLDDIRIWGVARTGEEIRASMYHQLRGNEPNLMGLWNFDDGLPALRSPTRRRPGGRKPGGDARDVSPNKNDGVLKPTSSKRQGGGARCVVGELPSPYTIAYPAVVFGTITDEAGDVLSSADVRLEQDGKIISSTTTDDAGNYRMVIYPTSVDGEGVYDISATWEEKGAWQVGFHLNPKERRRFNLKLKRAVSISGTLWTYDNTFHTSVAVQAVRNSQQVAATTLSDNSGKYHFINLKQGQYLVRCQILGGYTHYGGGTLQVEKGKTLKDIDFRFAPFKKGTWRNYGYLDGLADNDILDIRSTPDGLIWFATASGVSCYDGMAFVNLSKNEQLAHHRVVAIGTGQEGVLWFATHRGDISRYENPSHPGLGKGEFVNFALREVLLNCEVHDICQDTDGNLWIGTWMGGVTRCRPFSFGKTPTFPPKRLDDGKRSVTFTKKDGLADDRVTVIHCDPDGILWFGTGGGLSRYDGERFVNFTIQDGLGANEVKAIHRDAEGVLWVGMFAGGVSRYDGEGRFVTFTTQDGLIDDTVSAIESDEEGVLWIGTETGGLSRYDGVGFVNFTTQDGLVNNYIRTLHCDVNGVLWIGTLGGVSRYDGKTFVNYTTQDGLVNNNVLSAHPGAEGNLWIGTDGGVSRYGFDTQATQPKDGNKFVNFTTKDGLAHDVVVDIARTPDGILWFTTEGAGVSRYDPSACNAQAGGDAFNTINEEDGLPFNVVNVIHCEPDGTLWVGTEGRGLSRVERHNSFGWESQGSRAKRRERATSEVN